MSRVAACGMADRNRAALAPFQGPQCGEALGERRFVDAIVDRPSHPDLFEMAVHPQSSALRRPVSLRYMAQEDRLAFFLDAGEARLILPLFSFFVEQTSHLGGGSLRPACMFTGYRQTPLVLVRP